MYFIYNKYVQDELPVERRSRPSSFMTKLNKFFTGSDVIEYRGAI